ncbi:MAG: hypothetical protein ABSD27_06015 [Bryobacteraceae bacterium]|jgi:alpha-glucosidase (family GH31 glycosyl hydrolase)
MRGAGALAAAAITVVTWGQGPPRRVNTFDLAFPEGRGEIEWLSQSTFRFARAWREALQPRLPASVKAVPISVQESGEGYRFETRYLTVVVDRDGGAVRIDNAHGARLAEWRLSGAGERAVLEAPVAAGERLYGLGARTGPNLELGAAGAVTTRRPFLLSSSGYAEYYPIGGEYRFDLGGERRTTVLPGGTVAVFFYFGPSPKEVFEEHLRVAGRIEPFGAAELEVREPARAAQSRGSWETLRARVRALLTGSLSAELVPEFDLTPFAGAGEELEARAAQLASLMPVLRAPAGVRGFQGLRRRLRPYLLSYTKDARDRGCPVLRPLLISYDGDAEAVRQNDEFMLGDELLVAPVLAAGGSADVYFPRGIWTELWGGEVYQGQQRVRVRAPAGSPPMFVLNGTIVPLEAEDASAPLELHYFPGQAAEFFLYEEGSEEISQLHAGPADEVLRLEIESVAGRVYEWAIHRAGKCRKVEGGGAKYARVAGRGQLAPGRWWADAATGTLRIRVAARAGGDEVVNVALAARRR